MKVQWDTATAILGSGSAARICATSLPCQVRKQAGCSFGAYTVGGGHLNIIKYLITAGVAIDVPPLEYYANSHSKPLQEVATLRLSSAFMFQATATRWSNTRGEYDGMTRERQAISMCNVTWMESGESSVRLLEGWGFKLDPFPGGGTFWPAWCISPMPRKRPAFPCAQAIQATRRTVSS